MILGVLLHARLPAGVQNCGGIHSQGHCIIFDRALLGDLVRVIIVASRPAEIRLDAVVAAGDPATQERGSQLLQQIMERLDRGIRRGLAACRREPVVVPGGPPEGRQGHAAGQVLAESQQQHNDPLASPGEPYAAR